MQGIGLPHLLILLVIILVFFGPSRLPTLGQSIGKAIKGFKDGLNEIDLEAKDVSHPEQIEKNKQAQNEEKSKTSNSST